MDQSKKTMRHFYCRDVLWETFEQMANDFDCSIDYLINEAMRYYARSKNYHSPVGPGAAAARGPGYPPQPPPQPPQPQPPAQGYDAQPGFGGYGQAAPPPPRSDFPGAPPQPAAAPPPRPPQASYGGAGGGPTLYLIFNQQRYPIQKDQFIIGRGSKTSDLPIKDGNISRKHAAVIRRNGTYYIKDLGSTNGIDYKGMRIDNKRVDEGDVFHLCDYELRFTYRD